MIFDYEEEGVFEPVISSCPVRQQSSTDKALTTLDLSVDQREALDNILALIESGESQVTKLGGYAGTGKSTLIPFITRALGDTRQTAFCALSGKASNVMSRKLGAAGVYDYAHCGTIHSLIYKPLTGADGRILSWVRNSELVSRDGMPITRIILDEASMVGSRTLEDLTSYGVPILAVGDPGQLPPIQDESAIGEPHVLLKKIHRQAEKNPIIRLASIIREEGDIPRNWPDSHEIRRIQEDDALPIIADGFERLDMNFGILVRTNKTRSYLNLLPRGGSTVPKVGDIVICLKNVPPVYNGMRGNITAVKPFRQHWYETTVTFPEDGLMITGKVPKKQFGASETLQTTRDAGITSGKLGMLFDYGSALTVHKAQGSAFDECVLMPERWSRDTDQDYAQWLYTGVTRAANRLTIVRR